METRETGAHVRENRRHWDENAAAWVRSGERQWASEPNWGIFGLPEAELELLPVTMVGLSAVELGCGTGYGSAWMTRRGARSVGLDPSGRQLETARRLARAHALDIAFVQGDAEVLPFADGSFDFALSEYGAAIWADPERWLPEAWRVLRPGGRLVFLGNTPWAQVCSPLDGTIPCTERLERSYFELGRLDWTNAVDEPGGIEFNRPIGEWFRLFRRIGFAIEDYLELRAPAPGKEIRFYVTADWAWRYPAEHVWKLRKPA